MGPVDVVTVADFDGPAAARFELRSLLFLDAWLRHVGASRAWPLHLVCIGDPPGPVRDLAAAAGASLTVHQPLLCSARRNTNKLRAFDIRPRTDRLLLLDVDVLILRDLSPLAALVGPGIGVGAATINYIPETTWRGIYAATGVPYPGPTGTCWCADRRLAAHRGLSEEQLALCLRMPPFFNSGVALVPWALDLGTRWWGHHRRIVEFLQGRSVPWLDGERVIDDEPALATAVEQLRQEGAVVATIPWAFHARPLLLRAGEIRWSEIALFHYHNALNPHAQTVGELEGLLYGDRLRSLRRRVAARLGLRAIRSPLYRRVPPQDLAAFDQFYAYLHHRSYALLQRIRPDATGR